MNMYYFGCWDRSGHYLHDSTGAHKQCAGPFTESELDGSFAPGSTALELPAVQDDSITRISQFAGWTILAMWDRSVDRRYNSNCAFIAEGLHTEDVMWSLATENYPQIVSRLKATPQLKKD